MHTRQYPDIKMWNSILESMAENIKNEFIVEVEQIEEKVFIKEETKLEVNAEIKGI